MTFVIMRAVTCLFKVNRLSSCLAVHDPVVSNVQAAHKTFLPISSNVVLIEVYFHPDFKRSLKVKVFAS